MNDRDRDLQALIQDLRAGGRAESEGRFTLDSEHALEKLRRFGLVEHHHYVLPLLAAAVLSRARHFRVRTDADEGDFEFDGDPFTRDELRDLLSHLLVGGARPAVAELAAGAQGALGLNPLRVVVESRDARAGGRLTLQGGEARFEEVPGGPAGTRVYVRERWRWRTARRWMGKWLALTPEAAVLKERGALAPLVLVIEGRGPVSQRFDPGPCVAWRRLACGGGLPAAPPEAPWNDVLKAPVEAILGAVAAPPAVGGLTLVIHGVAYPPPRPWAWAAEIRAAVLAPDLTLDLSRGAIVANDAWALLEEELERQALQLAVDLAARRDALAPRHQEAALPLAARALQALPDRSPDRLPLLLLALAGREQAMPTSAPEVQQARLDLARHLRSLGREEEAGPHFLAALESHRLRAHEAHRSRFPPPIRALAEEGVSLVGEVHGPDTLAAAGALEDLGEAAGLTGEDALSASSWLRALEIRTRRQGREHLERAASLEGAALAERRNGRLEEGEALHEEAREIRERLLPAGHPDRVRSRECLAGVLRARGRLLEAEEQWKATLEEPGREPTAAPAHVLDALAGTCLLDGRLEDSLAWTARALSVRGWGRGVFGLGAPVRGEDHRLLAVLDHLNEVLRTERPRLDPEGNRVRSLARHVFSLGVMAGGSGRAPLFPAAEMSIFNYVSTAMEYQQQRSLDLALRTWRRATSLAWVRHGLTSEIYQALGWREVHLLHRLGRWAEADPLACRLDLLARWTR